MTTFIDNRARVIVGNKPRRRPVNKTEIKRAARFSVGECVRHEWSDTYPGRFGTIIEIVVSPRTDLLEITGKVSVAEPWMIYGRFRVEWNGPFFNALTKTPPPHTTQGNFLKKIQKEDKR